jgi:hypothetical protein
MEAIHLGKVLLHAYPSVALQAVDFHHGRQFPQARSSHQLGKFMGISPLTQGVLCNPQVRCRGHEDAGHGAAGNGVAGDRDVAMGAVQLNLPAPAPPHWAIGDGEESAGLRSA